MSKFKNFISSFELSKLSSNLEHYMLILQGNVKLKTQLTLSENIRFAKTMEISNYFWNWKKIKRLSWENHKRKMKSAKKKTENVIKFNYSQLTLIFFLCYIEKTNNETLFILKNVNFLFSYNFFSQFLFLLFFLVVLEQKKKGKFAAMWKFELK
jgi:hypothetical protein